MLELSCHCGAVHECNWVGVNLRLTDERDLAGIELRWEGEA